MATTKDIGNFVVNKVENKAVYDWMVEHGHVNDDELYLVGGLSDNEKPWQLLLDVDCSENPVSVYTITAEGFTEFFAMVENVCSTSATVESGYRLLVNEKEVGGGFIMINKSTNTNRYSEAYARYNGLFWDTWQGGQAISRSVNQMSTSVEQTPYSHRIDIGKANTVKLWCSGGDTYKAVTGIIRLYGR